MCCVARSQLIKNTAVRHTYCPSRSSGGGAVPKQALIQTPAAHARAELALLAHRPPRACNCMQLCKQDSTHVMSVQQFR
jgi:hypothetical protein